MKVIERNFDLISGNHDLEVLYSLNNFPIHMGCTSQPKENDIFHDLTFCISKSSALIQVSNLIPLDILYSESHYSGAVGKIWHEHHNELAKLISKYNAKNIFEIGGQHDNLFQEYSILQNNFKWTIIDPGVVENINPKINIIKNFFDENIYIHEDVDCIVHSHFFEHLYDPMSFIKLISSQLNNKLMIFSVPNLGAWLSKNYSNAIHFEHTYLLNENYIEYMLGLHKLKVVEKKYFAEDHSIFYVVEKDKSKSQAILLENYENQKNIFLRYINDRKNIINNINYNIKNDENVFVFGAHVTTQVSLWMGLNQNNIVGILDNNKNKQGQRLYGTDYLVYDPNEISNFKNVTVIIDNGKYTEEIKSSLHKKNNHIKII